MTSMTRADLGGPACRILDAMVWLEVGRIPMPWPRSLVAFAADHLPRAGAFKGYLAKMKALEFVSYRDGGLVLEHEGRAIAGENYPELKPFSRERYWALCLDPRLKLTQGWIVCKVRAAAGDLVEREAIRAGYVSDEGTFRNAMARLLSWDLIEVSDGRYRATQSLYPRDVFEQRELGR